VNDHASRLLLLLREAGAGGIERDLLPIRLGITLPEVERVLFELSKATLSGNGRVYLQEVRQRLAAELLAGIDEFHRSHPLEEGLAVASLRGAVRGDGWLIEESLRGLVEEGEVEVGGGTARRAGWRPALSERQEALKAAMFDALSSSGREPPSVAELERQFGNFVVPLLRILEKEGFVVQVEPDRYFGRAAVDELVLALRQGMADGHTYSPADLREMLAISRKYLIPFLEYCDREGVTERRQTGRVLHNR
jgi:selenocysteine-specific elongation factor